MMPLTAKLPPLMLMELATVLLSQIAIPARLPPGGRSERQSAAADSNGSRIGGWKINRGAPGCGRDVTPAHNEAAGLDDISAGQYQPRTSTIGDAAIGSGRYSDVVHATAVTWVRETRTCRRRRNQAGHGVAARGLAGQ